MATKLTLFNTALGNIGVSDYLTDTAGASKAHKVLNQIWPTVLAEFLSLDVDWSFTRRRETLTPSETYTAPINWAYAFVAPTNCMRVRSITIPGLRKFGKRHAIEHEVVRIYEAAVPEVSPERVVTLIYCDVPEIEIVYSASLSDSEIPAMTPSAAYALACLLASRIALPMSMKPEVMNLNMQTYNDALSEAIAQDMNEGETGVPPTPELLDGRSALTDWR